MLLHYESGWHTLSPPWWPFPFRKWWKSDLGFSQRCLKGIIWETLHIIFSLWKFIMHIRKLKAQKSLRVKKPIWFCLTCCFLSLFGPLFFTILIPLRTLKNVTPANKLKKLLRCGGWGIVKHSTKSHPFPGHKNFRKAPKNTCFVPQMYF